MISSSLIAGTRTLSPAMSALRCAACGAEGVAAEVAVGTPPGAAGSGPLRGASDATGSIRTSASSAKMKTASIALRGWSVCSTPRQASSNSSGERSSSGGTAETSTDTSNAPRFASSAISKSGRIPLRSAPGSGRNETDHRCSFPAEEAPPSRAPRAAESTSWAAPVSRARASSSSRAAGAAASASASGPSPPQSSKAIMWSRARSERSISGWFTESRPSRTRSKASSK